MLKKILMALIPGVLCSGALAAGDMERDFANPPDSARPGVYWYFMDGNLNGKEMTADLESMKAAGLGNLVFLEVDLGMLKGPVRWMTEPWQDRFVQIIRDAERLGIDVTLGIGPGWCGSGGPWIKPEQSMQHLVFSSVDLQGPQACSQKLPVPDQREEPFLDMRNPFYEDVAVLAFPSSPPVVSDINEKALYKREPHSIWKHVKPYLPTSARYPEPGEGKVVVPDSILDITKHLKPDGTLDWDVPAGKWTVVRMGRRVTGAGTRPAPEAALGLECDKFDAKALEFHLDQYVGRLLEKIGQRAKEHGLTTLHMDSWESGAQNWTPALLDEFKKRRGYDARPWLLAYTGRAVESLEKSERFLWDLRLTAQELVLESHAGAVKKYGQKHGLSLSIEPYDMNPSGDLDLGAVADVPMAEFWNNSVDSAYSCFESASIAHVMGRPIVSAEAFTSEGGLDAYPWSLKNQGDWAFCVGINRFVFHTWAHQTLGDAYKPGMTFGPYGVHWHRNQTWWPMVGPYHRYLTRCSELLRQGVTVSDVLYLTPEGAPHIFEAPASASEGTGFYKDKKGYGFDGCSPKLLMARAAVKDGMIAFPGGTSYRLLVLPQVETMTPALLAKILDLVKAGATMVGTPPLKSPSLSGYPACDSEVQSLARDLWGSVDVPKTATKRRYGKGFVHWGGELSPPASVVQRSSISESEWIWYPEGNPAQSAPVGARYFQRIINVDAKKVLASATAGVSADNEFTLWINGKKVSEGDSFHVTVTTPITSFLRPGDNVIAVAVANTSGEPNPAGWIGAFDLVYKDGSREVVKTDGKWSAGLHAQPGWEQTATKPGGWKDAQVLGAYAMAPWSRGGESQTLPPLYPPYDLTAALLKGMGVVEDFTATGPVRYGHRRTNDRDIYFVANRTDAPVKADCCFRVGRGSPQLWDPVTGEQRPLPQFERADGRTRIPMEFDAFQSFFVVFSGKNEKPLSKTEKNFPELKLGQELAGAWEVAFDPKWGGPERVTFDALQDWTTLPEPGIKYYSGIASYRKAFDFAPGVSNNSRLFLSLGTVHDMARVRLNGKDLGVVWCAPWRVDITGAINAGENQLEIEVVNRWPNRMIGDKQPADANVRTVKSPDGFLGGEEFKTGRYTFSTSDPYGAQSPLFPSGLLGPVRVMRQE
ncbi:MAG: glycosyl hydrolase [Pirellulaceae bacterium]